MSNDQLLHDALKIVKTRCSTPIERGFEATLQYGIADHARATCDGSDDCSIVKLARDIIAGKC